MYKSYIKRILDFIASLVLLFIFSPIIIACFILLLFVNKGKVLFLQVRPGYQCVPFTIFKFKTMHDGKDIHGNLLPDEFRLTHIGKLIRALSIDELLQLINVLKGDMSLVGPRPLLTKYLTRYTTEQIRRHNVRPGITGWAQVNGRNSLSWEEKFKLDVEYVENISFFLDMKILYFTIFNILKREGINAKDHATMEEFKEAKNEMEAL